MTHAERVERTANKVVAERSRDQWQLAIATLVPNLNLGGFLIYRRNALTLETRLAVAK